jgi:Rad3-related DNA helicase
MTHNVHDRDDVVESIERSECVDNAVLVTPSMARGLDIKDDLCRFTVVPKVPWLNCEYKGLTKS